MAYCIIILLYRMGFSSTEIIDMKPENIRLYNNGAYAFMPKRDKANFIPEDVYRILELYLAERESNEYLFYNNLREGVLTIGHHWYRSLHVG